MGCDLKIIPAMSRCEINAPLVIPSSKSHTMRALLLGALLSGWSKIDHYLPSPDTDLLIESLRKLGAEIIIDPLQQIRIRGLFPWNRVTQPLDVGNSGIQLRFLTALASLSPHPIHIRGDCSLSAMRPMDDLLQALGQLGANYSYLGEHGKAPFIVQGPIKSGRVFLEGGDSQPVSALLLALAFLGEGGEIFVKDPCEIPWINMTLHWLARVGAKIEIAEDHRHYTIIRGIQETSFQFSVPADYSSLAYPFSLAMMTQTPLSFQFLNHAHDEGDAAFLTHIKSALGGNYHWLQGVMTPSLQWDWEGGEINLADCIDLTSLFTVLAMQAKSTVRLVGIQGAQHKECDRLVAIREELCKMGGKVEIENNALVITPSVLRGTTVSSWGDHRMVLALTIAAMIAEGTTVIENARCILKSYPNYIEQMQRIGFQWEWIPSSF